MPFEDTQTEQQLRGIYSLADIDKFTFSDIEAAKNTLLINLSNTSNSEVVADLKDLFTLMQSMLEKYYCDNLDAITKQKITISATESYNFYQIQSIIPLAQNDKDLLREICRIGFTNYNILIKPFVSIPTTTVSAKKKIMMRLFSIVKKDINFYDNLEKKYKGKLKVIKERDSYFNWKCFLFSEFPNYDLDGFKITFGAARIGKSTDGLQVMRTRYQFQYNMSKNAATDYIIKNNKLRTNVLYDEKQSYKFAMKSFKADYIMIDEGYLFADRREAMTQQVTQLTQDMNTEADRNNMTNMIIQDLSDLDNRCVNKANNISEIIERGEAIDYARDKHFTILKDYYGFEYLVKHPWLLNSKDSGLFNLAKIHSFITQYEPHDLTLDPLFIEYKKVKKELKAEPQEINQISKEEIDKINSYRLYNENPIVKDIVIPTIKPKTLKSIKL